MAKKFGKNSALFIGGPATGTGAGTKHPSMISMASDDAGSEIDTTTVDDVADGYMSSEPGLKSGVLTVEGIYDPSNAALESMVTNGTANDIHAYIDTAIAAKVAWEATATESWNTGGPNEVVRRTVTYRRRGSVS